MRHLLAFLLVLSSCSVLADDSHWVRRYSGSGNYGTEEYPSAVAACIGEWPADSPRTFSHVSIKGRDGYCQGVNSSGGISTVITVYRLGSCTDGTLNPETGECESDDECADLEGVSRNFRRSGTAPDAFMFIGGNNYAYDQNICVNGCSATVADAQCTVKIDGPYVCVGSSTYTGASCTGGPGGADPDTSSDETDETDPPPPEKTEDYKPCIYSTSPGGAQTCISENNQSNDGSCGTFNGEVVCNPNPEKTEQTIETTVETTTNPDGSTTTTKTDTLTTNHCVGANACSTTTTTITTTTNRDADGNVESVSGICTGPQCPDKNTNPDGDGDGFGDCIGPMCGEGEEGSFEGAELGEVKEFGESVEDFMDRARNAPIMQAISGIAFPSGGSCGFGAASTKIGVISLDGMCDNSHWLDPLYPIFLAAWCFAAIRKFMEA